MFWQRASDLCKQPANVDPPQSYRAASALTVSPQHIAPSQKLLFSASGRVKRPVGSSYSQMSFHKVVNEGCISDTRGSENTKSLCVSL